MARRRSVDASSSETWQLTLIAGSGRRQIGPVGTVSRTLVGLLFLVGLGIPGGVTTVHGQYRYRFDVVSVTLGAVVFPAVVLVAHSLAVRHRSTPLRATGPVATTVNLLLLVVLFLIPEVAPPIYFRVELGAR